jgi:hypothetical protein
MVSIFYVIDGWLVKQHLNVEVYIIFGSDANVQANIVRILSELNEFSESAGVFIELS